jgi:hypothetical protein
MHPANKEPIPRLPGGGAYYTRARLLRRRFHALRRLQSTFESDTDDIDTYEDYQNGL